MNEQDYANYHMRRLKAATQRTPARLPQEVQDAVRGVLQFMERRLSEAAKEGCHHCDEVGPGEPCRWCGLAR